MILSGAYASIFLVWHSVRQDDAANHGVANTIDRRGGFMMVSDPQVAAGFRWIHTWMPTTGALFHVWSVPAEHAQDRGDFVHPCPACRGSPRAVERRPGPVMFGAGGSCRTERKIWDDFGPDENDDRAMTIMQVRSCTTMMM